MASDAEAEDVGERTKSAYPLAVVLIWSPRRAHWRADMFGGALFLVLDTFCQLLIAFALFDASYLSKAQDEYVMYASGGGQLSIANFYEDAYTAFCGDLHGRHLCWHVPNIFLLAALVGLALLAAAGFDNDVKTMLLPSPTEMLSSLCRVEGAASAGAQMSTAHGAFCFVLQYVCWTSRFVLLPVLVHSGTAFAISASYDAQDIVLNSLAATFIYGLDVCGRGRRSNLARTFCGPGRRHPAEGPLPERPAVGEEGNWAKGELGCGPSDRIGLDRDQLRFFGHDLPQGRGNSVYRLDQAVFQLA
eukprot:4431959-Prymnesium_polylepis.2